MKLKIYSILFFLTVITGISKTEAQSPDWLWAKGIIGIQNDEGNSVATDLIGNSYITGSFQGTIDFDPGSNMDFHSSNGDLDVFLLKLDPAGNFLWVKTFGGTGTDEGISITIDPFGNLYMTGHFSSSVDFDPGPDTTELQSAGSYDVFISKINTSGNFLGVWKIGGGSIDEPTNIVTDMDGKIYLSGYFSGSSDFDPDSLVDFNLTSAGSQDIFIAKIDSSGDLIWAVNMGGASGDRGQSLSVDLAGNVYSTGYFASSADFDPGAGMATLTSNGAGPDIFISKLDASGNYVWAKSIGSTNGDRGFGITVDGAGNIYATGVFTGTVDFDPDTTSTNNLTAGGANAVYVLKLNNAGDFRWAKALTTTASNGAQGQSIVIDQITSDVVVAGYYITSLNCDPTISNYTLSALGNDEVFISKFDQNGNFQWAKSAGGTNSDLTGSVSMNAMGYIYLAGTFHSPVITFDAITITNAVTTGFPDIFISKLDNIISGVNETSLADGISLYPNPAAGMLYVSLPVENVKIKITDLKGQTVYEATPASQGRFEIPTLNFAEGMYLVSFTTEKWTGMRKVMVIR